MTKTLTRVYSDYASAELAVRELKAAGLGDSHIGIVASNDIDLHARQRRAHLPDVDAGAQHDALARERVEDDAGAFRIGAGQRRRCPSRFRAILTPRLL